MAAPLQHAQVVGFDPTNPAGGVATQALSTTSTWIAFSFVPDTTTTLSGFRAFCSAVTGTPASNVVTATLFTDSSGQPGSSVGGTSSSINGGTSITASAWAVFGSWSGTLNVTAGTRYFVVISCSDGANFPTFRYGSTNTGDGIIVGTNAAWGYSVQVSTNGGTTWTTKVAGACGWRVDTTDGNYYGQPVSNIAASGTAHSCNGTNEVGAQFTLPNPFNASVRGLAMYIQKSGSPTGNLSFKLYQGAGNLLATTRLCPNGNVVGEWITLYFSSAIKMTGGATYQVTAVNSATDSTSNRFTVNEYAIDSDSNSAAQFEWSLIEAFTANSGSSFSTAANTIVPFALILDTPAELYGYAVPQSVMIVNAGLNFPPDS